MFLSLAVMVSGWFAGPSFAAEADKKPGTTSASKPAVSRLELKSRANQMATGIRAAELALTPAELAIAQRVEVGEVACELGVTVNVKSDARMPGYFDVQVKKFKFRMTPVVTSTGAIRLEDLRAGAVWLQLSNKSMLMSQKQGSRLADVCMNPAQRAVAHAMEINPPVSLLEPVQAPSQAAVPTPAPTVPPPVTVVQ
jgi:hypothetical protein